MNPGGFIGGQVAQWVAMTNPQPNWGPGAPDPNQPAWQAPPPAKKGSSGVIITLVVLLLLALVGVGGYFAFQKFVADDSDDSGSDGDKKTSEGKLIAPEGESFTLLMPTSMKQVSSSGDKSGPAVKLELNKPEGDDPIARISAGTYAALNGKDLQELSDDVSAQADTVPDKVDVGGREAISYVVNQERGESTPGTTDKPKTSQEPTATPKATDGPKTTGGPSDIAPTGDAALLVLRVVLVPMEDESVVAINCLTDVANAEELNKACEDVVKSVEFKDTKDESPAPTTPAPSGPTPTPEPSKTPSATPKPTR